MEIVPVKIKSNRKIHNILKDETSKIIIMQIAILHFLFPILLYYTFICVTCIFYFVPKYFNLFNF
jgi:hypothetical protein